MTEATVKMTPAQRRKHDQELAHAADQKAGQENYAANSLKLHELIRKTGKAMPELQLDDKARPIYVFDQSTCYILMGQAMYQYSKPWRLSYDSGQAAWNDAIEGVQSVADKVQKELDDRLRAKTLWEQLHYDDQQLMIKYPPESFKDEFLEQWESSSARC